MSGHVKEHCETPGTFMRRTGATWICSCGKIYKIVWGGAWDWSFKYWEHIGHMDNMVLEKTDA